MKISIARSTGVDTIASLQIEHLDEQLEWVIPTYERTKFTKKNELFDNVNNYLDSLDADVQGNIWQIYNSIYEALETIDDSNRLAITIRDLATNLYKEINLDDLEHWCKYYAVFAYPNNLKDIYGEGDVKELTYLRNDYFGLLYLATVLRFMVPVWGEYIRRSKGVTGNVYKEYLAAGIIGQSEVFKRPEMARLLEYVGTNQQNAKVSLTAIVQGLGSVETTDWLLALIMIRRISVAETSVPEVSIISNIYNFLTSKIDGVDKQFGNKIREKHKPNDNGGDDDNASKAETYKVKQTIADSSAITISVYMNNYINMAIRLYPDISLDLVEECVGKLLRENNLEILPFRIQLASVIAEPVISVRSLESLEYPIQLRLMGVCQACLIHLGMIDLAHLLTATGKIPPLDTLRGDGGGSRTRLSKENNDELNVLYPHWRKAGRNPERQKNDNVAILFIEGFNSSTQELDWTYNSPLSILPPKISNGRPYRIPGTIKNLLADLILTIKKQY